MWCGAVTPCVQSLSVQITNVVNQVKEDLDDTGGHGGGHGGGGGGGHSGGHGGSHGHAKVVPMIE